MHSHYSGRENAVSQEDTRQVRPILEALIDVLDWPTTLRRINDWASHRQSRYICICNVHSVITAQRDAVFRSAINGADMATPDGAPVAWLMRRHGTPQQQRISGPDLMWKYLAEAEGTGRVVSFYGGNEKTLGQLCSVVAIRFPQLIVGCAISPPFRALSPEEDAAYIEQINQSATSVLFVSLGCPKQELWMAAHRGKIHAVMIGVGAAFDYHAGTIRRAPLWMQNAGLEWLHRLASEPRRLWKRYLVTNTLFFLEITRLWFKRQGSGFS